MNFTIKKGLLAHERLPSTYANVGLCDLRGCIADLYYAQNVKIKVGNAIINVANANINISAW